MSTGAEQQRLADTFVSLADTLVDDFDLLDFLGLLAEKASEHLTVAAAGVILSDQRGGWRPTATSHETPELVQLFTAQTHDGPCLETVRTAAPVASPNLNHEHRWPAFAHQVLRAGYHAAAAVPMRSQDRIIGSLALLNTAPGGVDQASLQLGQSLADMATIGLLQQHASRRGDILAEQLEAALHHRVVLEQAKGVLAEHANLPMDTAYRIVRDYARQHGQHLAELARSITTGNLDPAPLLAETTHSPDTPVHGPGGPAAG